MARRDKSKKESELQAVAEVKRLLQLSNSRLGHSSGTCKQVSIKLLRPSTVYKDFCTALDPEERHGLLITPWLQKSWGEIAGKLAFVLTKVDQAIRIGRIIDHWPIGSGSKQYEATLSNTTQRFLLEP